MVGGRRDTPDDRTTVALGASKKMDRYPAKSDGWPEAVQKGGRRLRLAEDKEEPLM